jgi:hypothetical protein
MKSNKNWTLENQQTAPSLIVARKADLHFSLLRQWIIRVHG